ncbi:MAG TPA: Ig-like domain-containing protein, partial [Anaerolineales bacterium]|nr:Ig-like domain-containing protein [Anaerolineales bacterium]
SFEFTTMGDLQVSQVFPLDGAEGVDPQAVLTVIFNRPVVPLGSAEDRNALPDPLVISPPVAGRGEWVNTSVYAFQPSSGLRSGTAYTVVAAAGLEDALGETQLDKDFVWQFSTRQPSFGFLELGSGVQSPKNNAQDVLLDEYFRLYFNQPMNPPATEAALRISPQDGAPISYVSAWNETFTRLVVTPTQRLELDRDYLLRLDETARAADGGALPAGFQWRFTTVPPPALVTVSPAAGARQTTFDSELRLQFASPMNIDSVKARIEVSPPLPAEADWWYDEYRWSIVTYSLQPSTTYEVRLLPGMQDIYGNVIRSEQTVQFTTAAYDPQASLEMPYAPAIFRAGEAADFYISYRNIQTADLSLYRLSTSQFLALLSEGQDRYRYNPPPADQVWSAALTNTAALDERVLERHSLSGLDGAPLEPGFYFLGLKSSQVYHDGPFVDNRLVIVATGNLTFKSASNDSFLWFTDLNSGAPVPGVALTVYDGNFKPVGSGVTDAEGRLQLETPAPDDPFSRRYALTDGGQAHFAFASSEWGSGVNLYDYGLWTSYFAPPDRPTVYLYTERPIYRPGQPVYFKGILRTDDDLNYQIPQVGEVEVVIDSYEEQVYRKNLSLTAYGT